MTKSKKPPAAPVTVSASEEDIKIGETLPWLQSLGIDPKEITAEKSFTIRLGRYTYQIESSKQVADATGRLDLEVVSKPHRSSGWRWSRSGSRHRTWS